MAYLALVRHGKSEWNALGLWTGLTDIPLNEEGHLEAERAATGLSGITFDHAYTSMLKRAQQTLEDIKKILHQDALETTKDPALNERDYGDFTGKNKWDVKKELGEETFIKIRRSWDYPPPNGESLKDVYARVVPYYQKEILPQLKNDKNILIAAHGNSLRALVKYLENISDDAIPTLEIGTGEVYLYEIDNEGKVVNKEIRSLNKNKATA